MFSSPHLTDESAWTWRYRDTCPRLHNKWMSLNVNLVYLIPKPARSSPCILSMRKPEQWEDHCGLTAVAMLRLLSTILSSSQHTWQTPSLRAGTHLCPITAGDLPSPTYTPLSWELYYGSHQLLLSTSCCSTSSRICRAPHPGSDILVSCSHINLFYYLICTVLPILQPGRREWLLRLQKNKDSIKLK